MRHQKALLISPRAMTIRKNHTIRAWVSARILVATSQDGELVKLQARAWRGIDLRWTHAKFLLAITEFLGITVSYKQALLTVADTVSEGILGFGDGVVLRPAGVAGSGDELGGFLGGGEGVAEDEGAGEEDCDSRKTHCEAEDRLIDMFKSNGVYRRIEGKLIFRKRLLFL